MTNEEKARRVVLEEFGEGVDLNPGTSGYAIMKIIEMQLDEDDKLRAQCERLAEELRRG